jgi:Family of unknown function (DUF6494)
MDEDTLNVTIRKFLKEVGVTSQRQIEKAVRDALGAGRLAESAKLRAKMTLEIDAIGLRHMVEGNIELS